MSILHSIMYCQQKIGADSEFDRTKTILMYQPSYEILKKILLSKNLIGLEVLSYFKYLMLS